jgi:hypothetical protein
MNSLEANEPANKLVEMPGFKRSLPLIDDNRKKVLSKDSFGWICALMRQDEGGKQ